MKFKRIEIYGFKSFADKHQIPFGSGITAIVGPNGCGKSNVADSIRWVLGEQSAKLLRGSSMQDVIFNGTEKRKSMSYCEVALVFDNREKLFPTLDYEEVVISRKLYRSGESEYALNRTPCRLRDIVDLLRDGGMGREGYSIIGQGRIDELLSAKPEDRRQIFEEAAGISKFKAKKVEAERRLARTQDNMTRVIDILEEKSKQLEPLNRQAEAAKKWLDMRDKLKHHEINSYIYQYDTASQAKEIINNRLNGIIEEMDIKQKEYETANGSYNETMAELNSIDKNIDAFREELLNLTVEMEKQRGDVNVLKERLSALFDTNRRLSDENDQLDKDGKAALKNIEQTKIEREKKLAELKNARDQVENFRAQMFAAVTKINKGEKEAQDSQNALLQEMEKLAEIKANMSRMLAEREALNDAVKDLSDRIAADSEVLSAGENQCESIKTELADIMSKKHELAEKLKALYARNNDLLALANETTFKLDKLNERFYTADSRRKILHEMQQAYEGFAFSVRNLMNDAKSNPELSGKIEGVVAQIINVEAKFETAIETSLGQSMQNIVTRNEEDAKFIIEYLKRKGYGRITFLPMSAIKPRTIDARFDTALKRSGCFGIASDLVKYDGKYSGIVQGLLGNTVIVDNLDTAVELARATGYGFKIVTLDGDIINPHGAITGGSRKNDIANIFGHERELKELQGVVKKLSDDIATLTERKEKCAVELEKVQSGIKDAQQGIHEAEIEIAAKTETVNQLSSDIEERSRVLTELKAEIDRDNERIQKITTDINSVSALETLIANRKQSAMEDDKGQKQQYAELRAERDALQEKTTEAMVTATDLENQVKTYDNEIVRMQSAVAEFKLKKEANNVEIDKNNSQIATIEKSMQSGEKRDESADAKRLEYVRGRLSNLDGHKSDLQEKVTVLDKNRIDLMNELNNLNTRKAQENIMLERVDTDIEQMEQRVREEYGLEYNDCLEFKETGYDVNFGGQEIKRLKRAMSALGHVNVDAIEMSQIVAAEYNQLNDQKIDLEKAEANLLQIIKEQSDEMLSRFTTQFNQIRTNFIKIFKELFDGGNADLELLDSENPLEAGIEIKAQPPEKKLQSISLLSGGEKALTAIAILFAILKLKPMPFCLLDEIEAALDDANANRFAKYLRRFSEDTQFIVITHRKPTMELADSLYGVTMQEKGVSKIVSVKLEDAVAAVEKAQ